MKSIVITGASQGIGLELVRQALETQGVERVLAVARNPLESPELVKLREAHPRALEIAQGDVATETGVTAIVRALKDWTEVDTLINNAGVAPKGEAADDFMTAFRLNSVAPFLVTRALFDWLRRSREPKVVHITSLMGSLTDNESGGYYAYRASKAALNMIATSMTRDEPWLTTVLMHPGWVKTRMGGAEAPTEVQESARGIWKVTREITPARSGTFIDFEGTEIAW